jgi:hypothetical protein
VYNCNPKERAVLFGTAFLTALCFICRVQFGIGIIVRLAGMAFFVRARQHPGKNWSQTVSAKERHELDMRMNWKDIFKWFIRTDWGFLLSAPKFASRVKAECRAWHDLPVRRPHPASELGWQALFHTV